jgi:D-alanyl-D-alanine dipeptidase
VGPGAARLRCALLGAAIIGAPAVLVPASPNGPSPRSLPLAARQGPPPPPPGRWRGLIGEYGPDSTTRVVILERDGRLLAWFDSTRSSELHPAGDDGFRLGTTGPRDHPEVRFQRGASGRASAVSVWDSLWPRRALGPEEGSVFRITPVRPVEELRREALAASPPAETGEFRETDLVELVKLDSTIRLDIRYATARNFLGTPLYSQARAFMQRPAAEALLRAHRKLRAMGYGLLIHDAYRPWYVTRMFWDGTPPAQHEFVADPATGSRHNRGCAVDLTLYDLRTGHAVEMPGVYDEMSHRSYPSYPGGTSRQRWYRELLRRAMEAEGFTVYSAEWWHFDYKDWKSYRIGNTTFERLGRAH